MSRFVALLAAVTLAQTAPLAASERIPFPPDGEWRALEVAAQPWQIRGDAAPDKPLRHGRLIYRGGVALASPDPAFGGFSGIALEDDGARLLAVSDRGQWLEAVIDYDASGRIAGLSDARMSALTDKDGVVLGGKSADAESLSPTGDGRFFVGFEHDHRIDIYRRDERGLLVHDHAFARFDDDPPPDNEGLEAVIALDGGVLAVGEFPFASGADGFIIGRDGARAPVSYTREKPFDPTAGERLGDTLYFLERAYSPLLGVRARLASAPLPSHADPAIRTSELARFTPPFVVDNMEALDLRRTADGRTLLYVMSDDNHSARQKTILLVFEVADEAPVRKGREN